MGSGFSFFGPRDLRSFLAGCGRGGVLLGVFLEVFLEVLGAVLGGVAVDSGVAPTASRPAAGRDDEGEDDKTLGQTRATLGVS